MTVDSDNDLENQIAEWRTYVHRRRELHHTDAEELEDHLRSRITAQGRAELAEQRRQWAAVVDALKNIWQTTGEPPAVAVLRLEA